MKKSRDTMSDPVTHSNVALEVKSRRIFELAFVASAAGVLASIPISPAVQQPDLPGFVLVATGTVASLLALRRTPSRPVQLLVGLTALMAINVAVHQLSHRFGVAHDWLEPLYVGAVGVYCLVAFGVGLRVLVRDRV